MLTESQAAELLREAAATIEVEPRGERFAGRPLRAGAAIAAVVMLILGLVGTWAVLSGGRDGAVSPTETPTVTDSATAAPSESQADQRSTTERAAREFVALTDGGDVPWADEVSYFFAGEVVAVFDRTQAAEPSNWAACPAWAWDEPEGSGPFMRVCPLSPFPSFEHLVADLGGELTYEPGVPGSLGCDRITPLAGYDTAGAMTIRPDPNHRMCALDFAVMLYFDDGEVSAVDIVLGSP